MKYNTDRQIKLETAPKLKNLYPWALQEIDSDGEEASRDLIQWTLSHSFIASNLTLNESVVVEDRHGASRTWIGADLKPEASRRYGAPVYSMFGTERTIQSIKLFITPTTGEEASAVRASGFLSYTSDDPLWGSTEPDHLQFDLAVSRGEFDRLADRIAKRQLHSASFRCHARGFYAEWTPDIDTDFFKVLASGLGEQEVTAPAGCEIEVPRIGDVWDASFSISNMVELADPRAKDGDETDDPEEEFEADRWLDDSPARPAPKVSEPFLQSVREEMRAFKLLAGAILAVMLLDFFLN